MSVHAYKTVIKPPRATGEYKNLSECKGFNPSNPYK